MGTITALAKTMGWATETGILGPLIANFASQATLLPSRQLAQRNNPMVRD
jgi:hypothetical protein